MNQKWILNNRIKSSLKRLSRDYLETTGDDDELEFLFLLYNVRMLVSSHPISKALKALLYAWLKVKNFMTYLIYA